MQTVRFRGRVAVPRAIKVGVELDNGVEAIYFDLPQLVTDQIETIYWKNGEHADAVDLQGHVWIVENTMTQYTGDADCFIAISDGDELLWHSEVFVCEVVGIPDAEGTIDQVYPSAIQTAIGLTDAAADRAEEAAEAAADSAAEAAAGKYVIDIDESNYLTIDGPGTYEGGQ